MPTSSAPAGSSTGIFTIEMMSCGGRQSGYDELGLYDETYTSIRPLAGSGSRLLVCEPQSW